MSPFMAQYTFCYIFQFVYMLYLSLQAITSVVKFVWLTFASPLVSSSVPCTQQAFSICWMNEEVSRILDLSFFSLAQIFSLFFAFSSSFFCPFLLNLLFYPCTDSTNLSSPLPFLTQILPHSFLISSHCVGEPHAADQIFSILLWLYSLQESYYQHGN